MLIMLGTTAFGVAADTIDAEDQGTLDTWKLDSHGDDPRPGIMEKDDFDSLGEWNAYLVRHPELAVDTVNATANNTANASATLQYTLKNLPSTNVIQKFYIGSTYIYVVQKVGNNSIISRCLMDTATKTATRESKMTLKGFGHTQTLEWFEHNGQAYFWVGCKKNDDYDRLWAMQIGRIKYEAGAVIESYTDIVRFSNLNCVNKKASAYGYVKRAEAALSSDRSTMAIWMMNTSGNVQISWYNTTTLNSVLDAKENASSKHVSFEGNTTLKNACQGSFTQTAGNTTMPNGSCQGIEFSDGNALYMIGGSKGEKPKISKIICYNGRYTYTSLVTISNSIFNGTQTEPEGIQLKGDYVYFGIADHADKDTKQQYIYSIPKSVF